MFFISPAVSWTETDATLAVIQDANNIGAVAITSIWGPADYPVLMTQGESDIINTYGKPSPNTDGITQWAAIDYAGYANSLLINRAVGPSALNAVPQSRVPVLVKNIDEFQNTILSGYDFLGKYPGALANGINVNIVDSTNFNTWEYKSSFNYAPLTNEYNIAVVDTTGLITGTAAAKQVENISVRGTVNGGIREVRRLAFSGTVTGGIQQKETISVLTAATSSGNITVDGNTVAVVSGDSTAVVAGKIAAVLAAATSTYASATAIGNTINVTFLVPVARSVIPDFSGQGVTGTSVIVLQGSDDVILSFYNQNVFAKVGNTAAQVRDLAVAVFSSLTSTYLSAVANSTANMDITYFAYGPQSYSTSTQTTNGISVTTTVTTTGNSSVTLNVWGQAVNVNNGDSSTVVAAAIAPVLATAYSSTYDSFTAVSSNITYIYNTVGIKTVQTSPLNQYGLVFGVDVKTYGTSGGLIEKFQLLSNDPTSKSFDGSSNYFVDVINRNSKYLWTGDATIPLTFRTTVLQGGVDDNLNADLAAAYSPFSNSERYDINYIFDGSGDVATQKAALDVADSRRDLVTFISPQMSDVVNNVGNELTSVLNWSDNLINRETSYGFKDSNWAYILDSYNDKYRWIPTAGGTAGLHARTAARYAPWFPAAGHNRGIYQRYLKLAWSPNKGQRDQLYTSSVNPVVDFPGQGILLYGDKMSVTRPSAFNRINVRMAFIVIEKSIANFAKFFLWELNDQFTRTQFLNAVQPFLRSMQAQRAFQDFKVICDLTNNNGQVQAENKMVGTILIKPEYSINYIQLDFVAVRPDVSFDEVTTNLVNGSQQ